MLFVQVGSGFQHLPPFALARLPPGVRVRGVTYREPRGYEPRAVSAQGTAVAGEGDGDASVDGDQTQLPRALSDLACHSLKPY